MDRFDLAVAGAGIVGLAHALAAARRGLRVVVLEREARAIAASVRNFGFVTVSGQAEGESRDRALRSRDVWVEVASAAGIPVLQRGALVVARRPEAARVLGEFVAGPMGRGCELLDGREAAARLPALRGAAAAALWSPHELRIEARDALPRLARWLAAAHGVEFRWSTPLLALESTRVLHAAGELEAGAVVVAPGADVAAIAPELAREIGLARCKLQMMRIDAGVPAPALPGVLMSDLSLVRYEGFAAQPSAQALRARLERECAPELANGVHLIVAQGDDGQLVVGDSHHDADAPDPFAADAVDELVLGALHELLDLPEARVVERWVGHYPVASVSPVVIRELAPRARLVTVTSGTGMSTAFAIAEEVVAGLFG